MTSWHSSQPLGRVFLVFFLVLMSRKPFEGVHFMQDLSLHFLLHMAPMPHLLYLCSCYMEMKTSPHSPQSQPGCSAYLHSLATIWSLMLQVYVPLFSSDHGNFPFFSFELNSVLLIWGRGKDKFFSPSVLCSHKWTRKSACSMCLKIKILFSDRISRSEVIHLQLLV